MAERAGHRALPLYSKERVRMALGKEEDIFFLNCFREYFFLWTFLMVEDL